MLILIRYGIVVAAALTALSVLAQDASVRMIAVEGEGARYWTRPLVSNCLGRPHLPDDGEWWRQHVVDDRLPPVRRRETVGDSGTERRDGIRLSEEQPRLRDAGYRRFSSLCLVRKPRGFRLR